MTLLTVEDIFNEANTIYDLMDGDQKETMRALIDLYYLKVQNQLSNKILFSESEAICPSCSGVRLLKREYEDTDATSTLNKDFKCPICKSWYASSEVYSSNPVPDIEPIIVYSRSTCPSNLSSMFEGSLMYLIPPGQGISITGERYYVLPDGSVGKMNGEEFVTKEGVYVPDLVRYSIVMTP